MPSLHKAVTVPAFAAAVTGVALDAAAAGAVVVPVPAGAGGAAKLPPEINASRKTDECSFMRDSFYCLVALPDQQCLRARNGPNGQQRGSFRIA